MTLLTLVVIGMNIGCEDRIDSPMVNTPEGEPMTVTLNVDLADEADGASLYPNSSTKADKGEPFSAQLLPTTHTKADTKPISLYNLEIRQYDYTTGAYMNGQTIGTTTIGDPLTLTLTASDQCRLVIIARGENNTVPALENKSFAQVQSVLANTATIKSISTTDGTNMNKMPYILYLPNVKVADGKLQSPDGTDVRLRLKRLATKLTLSWKVGTDFAKNYTLKEVRLFQVPADYRILPEPEDTKWGKVYPSSVSNFIDGYRLKGEELTKADGTRTIWMPANAQGSSSAIAYPNLRSKRYVNPATTYAEFVVDNKEKKERFYYRVYLGGNTTTDFNLLENTDYNWTVNINSVKYTTDDRISMLDQTPVISTNLQPTANCFMMVPGTNICFNPYKHEAGTNGWNTYLTNESGSINSGKEITNVKVLWQTKDAGTSGDLVMGYVIDNNQEVSDHKNLVNLTNGSDKDNARIHVKVPVTNGGNALIAAYNSSNEIVWSWHLWITDYVPQGITSTINYAQAQAMTKGGSVHQYATDAFKSGSYANKVMMDRNLCATAGGFPGLDASNIEFAKRYGYQYQWGRKDPFFGSTDGTTNEIKVIYNGDGEATAIQTAAYGNSMLQNGNTLSWSIQHPLSFITSNDSWYDGNLNGGKHKNLFDNAGKKTLYDPCPNGWTLAFKSSVDGINKFTAYWFDTDNTFKETGIANSKVGGRLCNLKGETGLPVSRTIHNTAWYPVTPFRSRKDGALSAPTNGYYSFREVASSGSFRYYYIRITAEEWTLDSSSGIIADAEVFRCIQK